MDMTQLPILVVTDLDGTLLDHHDYSFEAAVPTLERLAELNIPVIFNTSKTQAELTSLRSATGNTHPFVVENGSAVHWPLGYFPQISGHKRVLGATRAKILECLESVRTEFSPPLEGFADWNVEQLVVHTGLSPAAAKDALKRDYSEPLLWRQSGSALELLINKLQRSGLQTLKGGRFVHVLGDCDKGKSLDWLRDAYQQLWGQRPIIIALGDGENDVAMLAQADWPVIVRSPQNDAPQLPPDAQKRCMLTTEYGPRGWSLAVQEILQQLGIVYREQH